MPVNVRCGACGKQLVFKTAQAGQQVPCPGCNRPVLVPPGDTPAQAPGPGADNEADRTAECDVCGAKLFRPEGILLTTRAVVSTPAYWRRHAQLHHNLPFEAFQ